MECADEYCILRNRIKRRIRSNYTTKWILPCITLSFIILLRMNYITQCWYKKAQIVQHPYFDFNIYYPNNPLYKFQIDFNCTPSSTNYMFPINSKMRYIFYLGYGLPMKMKIDALNRTYIIFEIHYCKQPKSLRTTVLFLNRVIVPNYSWSNVF